MYVARAQLGGQQRCNGRGDQRSTLIRSFPFASSPTSHAQALYVRSLLHHPNEGGHLGHCVGPLTAAAESQPTAAGPHTLRVATATLSSLTPPLVRDWSEGLDSRVQLVPGGGADEVSLRFSTPLAAAAARLLLPTLLTRANATRVRPRDGSIDPITGCCKVCFALFGPAGEKAATDAQAVRVELVTETSTTPTATASASASTPASNSGSKPTVPSPTVSSSPSASASGVVQPAKPASSASQLPPPSPAAPPAAASPSPSLSSIGSLYAAIKSSVPLPPAPTQPTQPQADSSVQPPQPLRTPSGVSPSSSSPIVAPASASSPAPPSHRPLPPSPAASTPMDVDSARRDDRALFSPLSGPMQPRTHSFTAERPLRYPSDTNHPHHSSPAMLPTPTRHDSNSSRPAMAQPDVHFPSPYARRDRSRSRSRSRERDYDRDRDRDRSYRDYGTEDRTYHSRDRMHATDRDEYRPHNGHMQDRDRERDRGVASSPGLPAAPVTPRSALSLAPSQLEPYSANTSDRWSASDAVASPSLGSRSHRSRDEDGRDLHRSDSRGSRHYRDRPRDSHYDDRSSSFDRAPASMERDSREYERESHRDRDRDRFGSDSGGRGRDSYARDSHPTPSCADFARGRCARGQGCRYRHEEDPNNSHGRR